MYSNIFKNKLKEILEFYTNENNWDYIENPESTEYDPEHIPLAYEDKGEKARELFILINKEEQKLKDAEIKIKLVYEARDYSVNKNS